MNNSTALQLLESASAHDRLRSARFLSRHASLDDLPSLERALQRENVSWIRNALKASIARANGTSGPGSAKEVEPLSGGEVSERQIEEIYSNALQEVTSQLLHEVEPLIGVARVYAAREVAKFEQSRTKRQLDLMDTLLTAIRQLRKASTPARPQELDLVAFLRDAKDQIARERAVEVQLAGPTPFNIIVDGGLLWLAFTNGLRNALEATEGVPEGSRLPVVVNWGRTERDFWISIIDSGIGLRGNLQGIFQVGTTSKKDHIGMGLPTARQAVRSLDGEVSLAPREDIGAKFEIRWPSYEVVGR